MCLRRFTDNYDKMNSVISFQQHIKWRKDTMRRMNVQKGAKALDVCCGTADWTIALAEAVGTSGEVVGLDFSQNMLKIGAEKVKGLPHVKLIHGNAMELPFRDNTFDFVTIGFGLRNVPDYMQVLREMTRVVKPGGKVVVWKPHSLHYLVISSYTIFTSALSCLFLENCLQKAIRNILWLQESARDFPGMEDLAGMFREEGLPEVKYKPYIGGVAAVHIGMK